MPRGFESLSLRRFRSTCRPMEESHSGLVRPPAKRLPGETWVQGSNPCSSALTTECSIRSRRLLCVGSGSGQLRWSGRWCGTNSHSEDSHLVSAARAGQARAIVEGAMNTFELSSISEHDQLATELVRRGRVIAQFYRAMLEDGLP